MKRFVLFLLLSISAQAKDLYSIRPLSEKQLLETYTSILHDACRHADQFWTNSTADGRVGRWGTGRSDGNEGVRANGGMVLACASLLKYSDVLSEAERAEYKRKSSAALRYVISTHVTGTNKSTDGKSWGNNWQSAFWASTLGFGAWLMWDDLDPETRGGIERVVAFESDRFLNQKPPAGEFNDTKAEENGWNMMNLALAANMFPNHPHAKAWNNKAIEFMMNTLSAPQDRDDESMIDGKAVNQWFAGSNVHPDFTLENHGFFHPSYVACSSYFLSDAALLYTYAHHPGPQATAHHLLATWRMFQNFIMPTGEPAYPQGMDWELHGIHLINLFANLACNQKDPVAAHLEQRSIQYIRAAQEMTHGDLAPPGSNLGFTRHCCTIDQISYAFLAHKVFGAPNSISVHFNTTETVHTYNAVQIISQRTSEKFFSFSWTNHVMGLLIPIADHETNPDFTVPLRDGFVGTFQIPGTHELALGVSEHNWTNTADGFTTGGTLLRNDNRVKQTVRIHSIGERCVVYEDRVTALTNITLNAEHGIPIAIENDDLTGNTRTLYHEHGKVVFSAQHPRPRLDVSGSWANVDGRLGIIAVAGKGIAYTQASTYTPGMCVRIDVLSGSFCNQRREFKSGQEIAHRIAVVMVETSPEQTEKVAHSISLEGKVLRFESPDGTKYERPLLL